MTARSDRLKRASGGGACWGRVFIRLDQLRCSWDGHLFVQGAINVDQEAIWFAIIVPVDDLGRTIGSVLIRFATDGIVRNL